MPGLSYYVGRGLIYRRKVSSSRVMDASNTEVLDQVDNVRCSRRRRWTMGDGSDSVATYGQCIPA